MRRGVNRRAEQLEALLEGQGPTEDADRELRTLASLAKRVHQEQPGPTATLTEDSRTAMRARLLADIAEVEAPLTERVTARPRPRRAVSSARAALATGVASAMIGTTGVAMAAQEAVPGDPLYNLKKGTETVRMSLAGDAVQSGRLDLRFAEERLSEVLAGADRNTSERLIAGLLEMDQRSIAGAERLAEAAERHGEDELLAEVDQFVERQSETLVDGFGRLPADVRPYAEDSLGVLRQIRGDLLTAVTASCNCDEVGAAGELCDCDATSLSRVSSDPLPRSPRGDDIDVDPATQDHAEPGRETSAEDERGPLRQAPTDSTSPRTVESRDLVPELPGRLDDVGRTVNDTVDDTTDTVRDTTERTRDTVRDTTERTRDTVEDTVDDTTDTVEDTVDDTTDTVEDTVEDTTDTVEDTVDDVGGLLGDD